MMTTPLIPKHIDRLIPYQAGKSVEEIREMVGLDRIIKLASNENPLGSSPKAVAKMQEASQNLSIYPRSGLALREKISDKYDLNVGNVIAASGSEGVLLAAMRSYLEPGDEVITAEGTFIGFYVIANAMNLDLKTVPLKSDYTYDLKAILNAVTEKTRMIYIANPNNPTGTAFTKEEYVEFLENLPEGPIVILDEAYFEYAKSLSDDYPDSLDYRHDQVLTLRTFSKAYGLAAVRIGYGIAHEDVIGTMLKVKLPFEPSAVSEAAGIGALDDRGFLATTIDTNRIGLDRLHKKIEDLKLEHTKSVSNFTLIPMENPEKAEWFSNELLQRGIIARPMVPFRLPHAVRITIGSHEEMNVLLAAMDEIFKKD